MPVDSTGTLGGVECRVCSSRAKISVVADLALRSILTDVNGMANA